MYECNSCGWSSILLCAAIRSTSRQRGRKITPSSPNPPEASFSLCPCSSPLSSALQFNRTCFLLFFWFFLTVEYTFILAQPMAEASPFHVLFAPVSPSAIARVAALESEGTNSPFSLSLFSWPLPHTLSRSFLTHFDFVFRISCR